MQTSDDASTWTTVLDRTTSSGTTSQQETYDLPARTARYVRIVGHGTASSTMTNITGVDIF